ncbi:hypothetical protein EEJ42_42710 [Streptomyces botrytidirepellens]|uniref:Uncharacterized protein n=2 Tax=Streptomyces botrytidirepellens TaxID=2486417 RepID=A0A3M8T1P5_9ACTN|nr:hypothetical protein EEJ42_42710 [Streptomyces botrytidirepellens]
MMATLVVKVVVAAVAALLAVWARYRLQQRNDRRKEGQTERQEDTQPAVDVLVEIERTIDEPPTTSTPEILAQLSRRLRQAEDDAPEEVQPSLARVGGRLDSYRSTWAVHEGTPPLSAAEDLRTAIRRAREAIRTYRRMH